MLLVDLDKLMRYYLCTGTATAKNNVLCVLQSHSWDLQTCLVGLRLPWDWRYLNVLMQNSAQHWPLLQVVAGDSDNSDCQNIRLTITIERTSWLRG